MPAELPEWVRPVAEYMLRVGLPETLRLAAIAVVGSTVIGIVLGTLITIRFVPLRALLRAYIEIWRGLPIVVTIFLIYYALPNAPAIPQLGRFTGAAIGLILWGSAQVAEATRGAVQSIPKEQHEASAALGFGWVGRHRSVILPQALRRLLPPLVGLLANIIHRVSDRCHRAPCDGPAVDRAPPVHLARVSRLRDLHGRAGGVLPDLVSVDAAGDPP